jgi:hypothetical protein
MEVSTIPPWLVLVITVAIFGTVYRQKIILVLREKNSIFLSRNLFDTTGDVDQSDQLPKVCGPKTTRDDKA